MTWLIGLVSAALLLARPAPFRWSLPTWSSSGTASGWRASSRGQTTAPSESTSTGRIVTFASAEVRAIYCGPAPAPPAPVQLPVQLPERLEALGALAMLRSVAQTGVTHQQYPPRLSEVQVTVDRYLRAEDGARGQRRDRRLVPRLGVRGDGVEGRSEPRKLCGRLHRFGSEPVRAAQQVIAESKQKAPFIWRSKGAGETAISGMVIANEGLPALWSCATDRARRGREAPGRRVT